MQNRSILLRIARVAVDGLASMNARLQTLDNALRANALGKLTEMRRNPVPRLPVRANASPRSRTCRC